MELLQQQILVNMDSLYNRCFQTRIHLAGEWLLPVKEYSIPQPQEEQRQQPPLAFYRRITKEQWSRRNHALLYFCETITDFVLVQELFQDLLLKSSDILLTSKRRPWYPSSVLLRSTCRLAPRGCCSIQYLRQGILGATCQHGKSLWDLFKAFTNLTFLLLINISPKSVVWC